MESSQNKLVAPPLLAGNAKTFGFFALSGGLTIIGSPTCY